MKKTFLIGLAVLFGACNGWAAEFSGNPDRFPSIGLNYTGSFDSGDVTLTEAGFSARQDVKGSERIFSIDTRIPISDIVTLNGAIGFFGSEATASETPLITGSKLDIDGGLLLNVGIRFYFHNSTVPSYTDKRWQR